MTAFSFEVHVFLSRFPETRTFFSFEVPGVSLSCHCPVSDFVEGAGLPAPSACENAAEQASEEGAP